MQLAKSGTDLGQWVSVEASEEAANGTREETAVTLPSRYDWKAHLSL